MTREVRANPVYREFTGVGGGKVPEYKTMGRLARQLAPEAIEKLHRRTVAIALEQKVVSGRKMRVDTTVVETNTERMQAYPLSDRQHAAGRRRTGVDQGDEESGRGGRQGGDEVSESLAEREAAHLADRTRSP